METIIKVTEINDETGEIKLNYPSDHPKAEQIEGWLQRLSPGYIEYLLQFGTDPHCNACKDIECENIGMGDDACPGFQFGEKW